MDDVLIQLPPSRDAGAALAERLDATPNLHSRLTDDDANQPEVVLIVDFDRDAAISFATLPDGIVGLVRYSPTEMWCCARRVSRTPDQGCLALPLPGAVLCDVVARSYPS
ncbi:MAG: hypothetical protein GY798_21655 [Hyphomicrobiales bacterium]|nr:hypothetical protein [Hyphomicrobiales bacterium]